MSTLYGADVAQLRELAAAFDRAAQQLDSGRMSVGNRIGLGSWVGPIAARFRAEWDIRHGRMIHAAAENLRAAAKDALDNAEEQTNASAAGLVLGAAALNSSSPNLSAALHPSTGWLTNPIGFFLRGLELNVAEIARAVRSVLYRMPPPIFQTWLEQVLKAEDGINVDGRWGNQCVDLINHYAEALFPGVPRGVSVGGGNACDIYGNANADYFEKIPPNGEAHLGDVVCIGPNKYSSVGHVAVVSRIEGGKVFVVQQNGNNPDGHPYETELSTTEWNSLQGYLRPRKDIPEMAKHP